MNQIKNLGWRVTMAGLGINLALGILYTWSIFKMTIKESILAGDGLYNWSLASLNDPYAVCCLVFAFAMIFAGRVQDRTSPRVTAVIGGILTGAGLILIAFSTSWIIWIYLLVSPHFCLSLPQKSPSLSLSRVSYRSHF